MIPAFSQQFPLLVVAELDLGSLPIVVGQFAPCSSPGQSERPGGAGRASKGEISKVLTSSAIAIVGLAFIAGAATLFFVGDYLINLIFE